MTDRGRLYSPQEVADLLGLHVRTVRRYLREGRLDAVRVGNRYRVPHDALETFTGGSLATPAADTPRIDVSSVVDAEPVDRDTADRLTTLLVAAVQRRPGDPGSLRLDVGYEPDRQRLKVVVSGPLASTSAVLALIAAYTET
ncbi:helix-turn-helix domain-containing protein [Nitriliruptoraceae bacterium ZYF776]|nr:helix-turn-helix domain-containing protein [Profundirhabdus halotolerans]